jgi:hypothetical protein
MIAGFSGHQDLGDKEKAQWVRHQLEGLLRELDVASGCLSLAVGGEVEISSLPVCCSRTSCPIKQ